MFLSPCLAKGEMEGGVGSVGKVPQLPCSQKKVGRVCLKDSKALDEVKIPGRRRVEHLGGVYLASCPLSRCGVLQDHRSVPGLADSFSLDPWGCLLYTSDAADETSTV